MAPETAQQERIVYIQAHDERKEAIAHRARDALLVACEKLIVAKIHKAELDAVNWELNREAF